MSAVIFDSPTLLPKAMESKAQRSARRHSTLVKGLRWLFPTVGILILAAMAGMVVLFNVLGSLGGANVILTSDGIVMDHPKLSGHDGDRSYQVTARRAIQRLTDPRIIDLEVIRADIVLSADETAKVMALKGIYDNQRETLRLYEGVQLEWSHGYTINVTDVDIDLVTGAISTSDTISIESDDGRLVSGRVHYDKDTEIARFTDGVKVILYPSARDDNS